MSNDNLEDLFECIKNNTNLQIIQCKKCHRKPNEIEEYIESVEGLDMTPEEYVIEEEGTFNHATGMFYCTNCYVSLGCPAGVA